MRLLSLTLDGFKSFAQKTTIKFETGMTGIVGPNGSGKSNIIEAIRWVMGEQSAKHLRGSKMADVIFNGSADRAPLNRAVVSITLDNSDHYLASNFNELTITRKLYRNGDSEYLLNGQKVRLKDITDLFVDSGLGRESFSIISQGRVAAIFNGKPEDRRQIIETVAGVAKYKQNKAVAEKRLATTMDNLNRVNDIISELSRQLDPLADQSALAKDYLEQKKQFDLLDRTRTVRQYDQTHGQLSAVNDQYHQAHQLVANYQQQTVTAGEKLANAKKERAALSAKKDEYQQAILQQTKVIAELDNQRSVSSVRQEQQEADYQRLQTRSAALKKQADQVQRQYDQVDAARAAYQQEVDKHQAEYDAATRMTNKERQAELTRKLEDLRNQQIELMQELTTVHNQQSFLERSHEQDLTHHQQSKSDLQKKQEQLVSKRQQWQENQKQLTALTAQQEQLHQQATAGQKQLAQLTSQYQQAQRQWYEALGDIHSTKSRIKNFQAMSNEYAGYYQGVKNVLQHQKQFPGLAGAVSELLEVPDKLTVAIETVLGGQLQQLVVDSQATGKAIINYLIRQRGGRVTILPLDTLTHRRPASSWDQVATLPGFVGRAADLVHYDRRYQLVVEYLLGNTAVVDNLDHATTIARAGRHQLRIVTLDGQLINASGAMTGGANRHRQRGLLSQKQVGKQLTSLLHQQEEASQQLEQTVADLKKKQEQQQASVNSTQDQLHDCQIKLQDIDNQSRVLKDQQTTIEQQVNALHYQTNQEDSQFADYQSQTADLKKQEQAATTKLAKVKQDVTTTTEQVKKLESNASAKDHQLHQMEQWLAVAAERRQQFHRQQKELKQRQAHIVTEQQTVRDELAALTTKMSSHHLTVESNETATKQAHQQLAAAQKNRDDCDQRLTELEKKLTGYEERHNRLQELQKAALNDANQLNERRVRTEATLDGLLNHLTSQYKMTINEARQNISDIDDGELTRQLKLLQRGLDDLGEVNVGAIEEYQRVKEHYDFLKGQQDDLLAARKQLKQTMNEMDGQVKDRFMSTFTKVSTAFDETFKQIFGGGRAKLVLTTPDDLLTTGVDIMAQPPGKKNQHLSLLSGGEKALTAITLLFAILKVRPVPFAILDEPEAALDEVNVQRFTNYLNQFGKSGPQFIVITHRKGTMMGADVLYGVTMQESGVSRIVSVDVVDTLDQKN